MHLCMQATLEELERSIYERSTLQENVIFMENWHEKSYFQVNV